MGVDFTKQQQNAINTIDKSVLVSAAAGSGKTTVLIQRIIKIILDGEAEVDEMLVVTFTKAAASEMRQKLSKAIKKKILEDPSRKAELKKQLNKLYRANISTFDSFATKIIKEFFYLVDIEPNFKSCDEIQSALMMREAIDDLFDEAFEDDRLISGGSFRDFLRLYSKERSEEKIKQEIIEIYGKMRTIPDYMSWARERAESLLVNEENFASSRICEYMTLDAIDSLNNALKLAKKVESLFSSSDLYKVFDEKLSPEVQEIEDLLLCAIERNVNMSFIRRMTDFDFVTLSVRNNEYKETYELIKQDVKLYREAYKKAIRTWVAKYAIPDFKTRLDETSATYQYTQYYINLLELFEKKYSEKKSQENQLDFADMEHIAVEILKNDEAADILRKRFKYIFIDEYQDTNNIQEHLISRFAHQDNVFKVGDVKQSIYRFRQAEPAIFQRVYKEYDDENNTNAVTIDLNQNFRTNSKTIEYINDVFSNIMDDYDDRAKLYPQVKIADENFDFVPEVHILYDDLAEVETDDSSESEIDNEIESITKEESEAKYVAKLVNELVGQDFYDTENNLVRKVEPRDITILMKSIKVRADIFARELRKYNIESHYESDENYFDTVEVGIALSLFSCIDNMKRDVPLIATLHSEIFSWKPEELANVRIAYNETGKRNSSYWEAFSWYAKNGEDKEIRDKANLAVSKIIDWRSYVNMMPLEDFVWKVLIESGYYLKVGAMYSGDRRQANLRVLVNRAKQYCDNGVASLNSFLNFIEILKKGNVKNGQINLVSKEDNVVQISTIHQSKGLEYPFVILSGLGHKFQRDKSGQGATFDSSIGIGLEYVSPDRKYWRNTLLQRAMISKSDNESFQEDLRVLYVGMTRARNKLILVGTTKSAETIKKGSISKTNYLGVMADVINTVHNKYYSIPVENSSNKTYSKRIKEILKSRPEKFNRKTEEIYEDIDNKLSYEYPYLEELSIQSKMSVSAIAHEVNEKEKVELLKNSRNDTSSANLGTAYHRILEFLDFSKINDNYILETIKFLYENGTIEKEVYEKIDLERIKKFFDSDLGKRAIAAAERGCLQKEKTFTLQTEYKGKTVLVQGIIDCCWEEKEGMVLIDYKTGTMHDEYKKQLELYSKAIEEGTGKPVIESQIYFI